MPLRDREFLIMDEETCLFFKFAKSKHASWLFPLHRPFQVSCPTLCINSFIPWFTLSFARFLRSSHRRRISEKNFFRVSSPLSEKTTFHCYSLACRVLCLECMYEYDALNEILLLHVTLVCVHINVTSQHVVLLCKGEYRFSLLGLCSCLTTTTVAGLCTKYYVSSSSFYFLLQNMTLHIAKEIFVTIGCMLSSLATAVIVLLDDMRGFDVIIT